MKCELGKCSQYTRVPGYETGSVDACTCVSIRRRSERYSVDDNGAEVVAGVDVKELIETLELLTIARSEDKLPSLIVLIVRIVELIEGAKPNAYAYDIINPTYMTVSYIHTFVHSYIHPHIHGGAPAAPACTHLSAWRRYIRRRRLPDTTQTHIYLFLFFLFSFYTFVDSRQHGLRVSCTRTPRSSNQI